MPNEEQIQGSETLSQDIKNIIGGVATLVLLAVPLLLIHTLRKRIEESENFKAIERHLV
ncbi:MAG: hypothetical protein IKG22_12700 [Atopobiaceae bacterium]|nr:hypothetical protein [Atopobiaceae bacterium]